ncbi:MAG: hypothetical protein COW03_05925 [Cytophagales bacterium CG12_big_fil_rev_8_21_14_0_65_40_12]|nr:MAG: hypothetical protein COW03_05925 [Cytophagales bacterium CG12_big_fil_rev_8_21_14_0_65_40_12]PIW04734.1 MAG: hypothetical protein COW40_08380 [Cytophagales bacterium CG17_big_fil_post_rev_8_21_14_2_50_40_13]
MKPLFYPLIIAVLCLKTSQVDRQSPIQLKTPPQLIATELDFGTDAITFCMHEGTKVRFGLILGELELNDLDVRVVGGQIDLKKRTDEAGVYLVNPKAEEFEVEVWVKTYQIERFVVPIKGQVLSKTDEKGQFITEGAEWKSLKEISEIRGEYSKVIAEWKFYSRVCE